MANGWSRKLSEPVKMENGRILKTLSDVRDLILRLGESEIKHAWWVPSAMSARCPDCRRERTFARPSLQVAKVPIPTAR